MAKTAFINTRVSPEDKAKLVKLAAKDNRTLAGLISKLLAEEMARGAKA
jgi:hypothetical protein